MKYNALKTNAGQLVPTLPANVTKANHFYFSLTRYVSSFRNIKVLEVESQHQRSPKSNHFTY